MAGEMQSLKLYPRGNVHYVQECSGMSKGVEMAMWSFTPEGVH